MVLGPADSAGEATGASDDASGSDVTAFARAAGEIADDDRLRDDANDNEGAPFFVEWPQQSARGGVASIA